MPKKLTAGDPLTPDPRRRRQPPRRKVATRALRESLGRILGLLFSILFVMVLVGGVGAYVIWERYAGNLPTVSVLKDYQPKEMSRVYSGNSQLIAEFATKRRIFVPINEIPPLVRNAFLAAEDHSFYSHPGIDPEAIVRAGLFDLMHLGTDRRPIGASTITQQVARNMLLDSDALTLRRKIREAILAMRIEQAMSKNHVLEIYLNEIYLGLQSYGVAAAAQAYFDKPLDKLDVAEAAFLGALPKGPNNYNPYRHPKAALERRNWVIDRMHDDGAITAAQDAAAKAEPLVPRSANPPPQVTGADWFVEAVRQQLLQMYGPDAVTTGGLTVQTSLDPRLQAAAEHALHQGLMTYDRRRGGWHGVVTNFPQTGVAARWQSDLAGVKPPPGMLGNWVLAEVISVAPGSAELGWLDPPANRGGAQVAHVAPMLLSDVRWARPPRGKYLGPPPARMGDLLHPGEVVMATPVAASPAKGRIAAKPARLDLRQIPKVEGALVSLDPSSGRVLAMVGGWSFQLSQFNRAIQAQRQPGSSFKPIVYLTALEHGISPSQQFLDAPFVENMGAQGQWRPGNYENTFNGPTALRIALEQSLNLVTIRVADYVGISAVAATAKAFHMVNQMPLVLPAALGAVDTTVMREAGAYASLDQGGMLVRPTLIDTVQSRTGALLWHPPAFACSGCANPAAPPQLIDQRQRIADPQSVYQLIRMMEGVVKHGTGVNAGAGLNRHIAGKTGTTEDFNDAWFSGFTPGLVTVVWVGFDTPQNLGPGQAGGVVAAPIWHDYMKAALQGRPDLDFPEPPGLTLAQWNSGDGPRTDAFKPGQVPGATNGLIVGPPNPATVQDTTAPATPPAGSGVDSAIGGLY